MKSNPPKVRIEKTELTENNFVSQDGYVYNLLKLIEQSKKYQVFDLPLAAIDLRRNPWKLDNIGDFIFHMKRCAKADLKYPIILDNYGTIADGFHRLAKAITLGKTSIKAVRLEEMPTSDRRETK